MNMKEKNINIISNMNMKEKNINIISNIIIVLIILFVIFIFLKFIIGLTITDKVCMLKYGDEWTSDFDKLFGRMCVKLNYSSFEVIERIPYPKERVNEICGIPKFWSFKWGNKCF